MSPPPPTSDSSEQASAVDAWVCDGDEDHTRRRASRWLNSPALEAVLETFGFDPNRRFDLEELRKWSATHLDTRAGQERHEATPASFNAAQQHALLDAAGPLGLIATATPTRGHYELTVILGGTVTGNRLRSAYTFGLAEQGVDLGRIVGAAGYRPLSVAEQAEVLADEGELANSVRDEYSHLAIVMAGHLRAGNRGVVEAEGADDSFTSWRIEALMRSGSPAGYLVRPPSRRAGRRADTLDAVGFTRQKLEPEASTLVITSAIYTPYTFFLLAPLAGTQAPIEIVGTPTSASSEPSRQAQRFAQEIHATLSVLPL